MGQAEATIGTPAPGPAKRRSAPLNQGNAENGGGQKPRSSGDGFFAPYKPDQGKGTRRGTFAGVGLLIAWGAWYVDERLSTYQGDEWWNLMITPGVAIAVLVVLCAVAWRMVFVSRKPSDFMIATEGEMKKVNWSSKREVIGSTKVVIAMLFLMAILLFAVDILFQRLFSWFGVLHV